MESPTKTGQSTRSFFTAYLVLTLSLALTLLASSSADRISRTRENTRFTSSVEQVRNQLQYGLNNYLTLVDSVRGLAVAKVSMSRQQFHAYAQTLNLRENYRGIQGVGVAFRIDAQQKAEAIEKMQGQGDSKFHIWPDSTRAQLCPLIYLEPQEEANLAVIGFDVFSEITHREAAERAVEQGRFSATGKITEDTQGGKRSGFVLYAPFFRTGPAPPTFAERQRNLAGFVYTAFCLEDLFPAILGTATQSLADLRVYDQSKSHESTLLYADARADPPTGYDALGSISNTVSLANHTWTLVFSPRPEFWAQAGINPRLFILFGGAVISALLFCLTLTPIRAQQLAEQHAAELEDSAMALREAEQSLVRAEAYSSVMITHVGLEGGWLKTPPTLCRLLGYTEKELLEIRIWDLICPEKRETESDRWQRLRRGQVSSCIGETQFLRKDGGKIWMSLDCALVTEANGDPVHFLAYLQDVTEHKRAEAEIRELNTTLESRVEERTAELRRINQELEERTAGLEAMNKELDAFTYSVSHDLRAPLRRISAFASLLEEEQRSHWEGAGRNYLKRIVESTTTMGRLIDDLLAFSYIGRVPVKKEPVDLGQLTQKVIHDCAAETNGRAVEWVIGPLPVVYGDEVLLRQVLINLIGNAVKYTATRSTARIEIGASTDGTRTSFIRDNGVGFDMRHAGQLFGVFQRLHSNTQFEGTGIGLANVQRIITRHGGKVWAEGVVDAGATFYFVLPGPEPQPQLNVRDQASQAA